MDILKRLAAVAVLSLLGFSHPAGAQLGIDGTAGVNETVLKRPAAAWVAQYSSDFATAIPSAEERRALGGIWNVVVELQEDVRSQTTYYRYARRFLTDESVGDNSDVTFTFDPNYQELVYHKLQIHRDGRIIDRLPEQSFQIVRAEEESERQVYSGNLKMIAVVEGVRAGDVLEYAVSIVGANPVFEGIFADSYSINWTVPVREARRRILLPHDPSDKRVVTTLRGGAPMKKTLHEDHVEYLWEGRDLPASISEDDTPGWYLPFSWIEISDYPDWQAVAAWAAQQYPISTELPQSLEADIAPMSELASPEQKVLAALRFVQDKVRYVGMFSGVHSHRPYPLELIVRRGFGDCKDKSLLLCSILHRLGIDAVPALVNTTYRHAIEEWPPSPHSFNHLITCVRLDGQQFWLDPTRGAQRGPLSEIFLPNYRKALIVESETTALTDIPKQGHRETRIEIEEEFSFDDYSGGGELQIKSVYSGYQADRVRNRFSTRSHDRIQKGYTDYYSRVYENIEASGAMETQDDEDLNRFTVVERYKLSGMWSDKDRDDASFRRQYFEPQSAIRST